MSAVPTQDDRDGQPAPGVVAWQIVLDRLERDVRLAEQVLAHPDPDVAELEAALSPWQAPAVGPLPHALLGRALHLARRLSAAREDLGRALAGTRADIERSRRTAFSEAPAAPAYVDVSA